MSKTSVHLLEVTSLIGKILRLVQACPALEVATHNDKLFINYCDDPCMSLQDEDEGMWFEVDKKLNCTFSIDNLKDNLKQGSLGIELAMKYLSKARDHQTWTRDSEKLLKIRLDRISQALIGTVLFLYLYALSMNFRPVDVQCANMYPITSQRLVPLIFLVKGPVQKLEVKTRVRCVHNR